ncbi:flavin monoamine oxidase family protein [Microbacterium elymi]|uniref:flavin monoamine oxidase family protein n=1 Tax=Microbacterium elymi TaxID=2909587 RepID=UPI00338D8487
MDAALAHAVAASDDADSYRDVTEVALARQPWDQERAQRVREYLQHRTEEQYGAWIEDLAAHGLDDDVPNGDEVIFPDGYDRLPARLAAGLDIRLEHIVTHLDWSVDGVTVTTGRGSFTADDAVVAVPVGVLHSGDLVIDPPLPDPVGSALGRLEMNAFEKVVLRFPTAFWDKDVYAIRQQGAQGAWWHSWYDLTAVDGTPSLLTFAAGPAAVQTRGWTEDRVVASVLAQLRRLYGDRVPQPTHAHVTSWQDDPFARGAYAYMPVGSRLADHDDLATPIAGVLHLAGEATWGDDPATVTAALCSGHRAAANILGRSIPISALWAES